MRLRYLVCRHEADAVRLFVRRRLSVAAATIARGSRISRGSGPARIITPLHAYVAAIPFLYLSFPFAAPWGHPWWWPPDSIYCHCCCCVVVFPHSCNSQGLHPWICSITPPLALALRPRAIWGSRRHEGYQASLALLAAHKVIMLEGGGGHVPHPRR